MNRYISNILKCIACLISWLTISPLFYYLTRKWGIMKKWISILLLCISPLFIYIYFFIFICFYVGYIKYQLKHKFDDKAIVEIELNDENQKFELPKQLKIIEEVTNDPKYKNSALASYR